MHTILAVIALTFALNAEVAMPARLVAFHGDACQPCLEMRPVLRRLEASGVRVERIDIDDKAVARKWRVRAVPTFIVVRGEQESGRIVGKTTFDRLRKLLGREPKQVLPDPQPERKKPERSVVRRKR